MKCPVKVILFFALSKCFEASSSCWMHPTSSYADEEDFLFRSLQVARRATVEIPKTVMYQHVEKGRNLPLLPKVLQPPLSLKKDTETYPISVSSYRTNVSAGEYRQVSGQAADGAATPSNTNQVSTIESAIISGNLLALEGHLEERKMKPGQREISLAAEYGHLHIVNELYKNDQRHLPTFLSLEKAAFKRHSGVLSWYWTLNINKPTISQLIRDGMYFHAEWCYFNKKAGSPYKDHIKGIAKSFTKEGNMEFFNWIFTKNMPTSLNRRSIDTTYKNDQKETSKWIADNVPRLLCEPIFMQMLRDKEYHDTFFQVVRLSNWAPSQLETGVVPFFRWLLSQNIDLPICQSQIDKIALSEHNAYILRTLYEYGKNFLPSSAVIKKLYSAGKLEVIKFLYNTVSGYSASSEDTINAIVNGHDQILEFIKSQKKLDEQENSAREVVVVGSPKDKRPVGTNQPLLEYKLLEPSSTSIRRQWRQQQNFGAGPAIYDWPNTEK